MSGVIVGNAAHTRCSLVLLYCSALTMLRTLRIYYSLLVYLRCVTPLVARVVLLRNVTKQDAAVSASDWPAREEKRKHETQQHTTIHNRVEWAVYIGIDALSPSAWSHVTCERRKEKMHRCSPLGTRLSVHSGRLHSCITCLVACPSRV